MKEDSCTGTLVILEFNNVLKKCIALIGVLLDADSEHEVRFLRSPLDFKL